MNWDMYREADKSINLVIAYGAMCEEAGAAPHASATIYLAHVMAGQPIFSRQVASLAIATAGHLYPTRLS